jgi:DNA invertase Pin-like site-specific DNA recombinase
MNAASVKQVRCAVYTRVSTDSGLDQDFNSLDAQYDAAQAYIRSQAHAHWTLIKARYDDGGFSGGSIDRPALQQLLADVKAHRVNVIVVYKVDRLTRSLADFAKLVELFDAYGVSFVSVTQQFNTTTSMGRLTLNVLLSFAQFEREVTSERIRDKIGASKRKGLWVGGVVPLGYHARDRSITVVEEEARTVRHIFGRYLELGSLNLLLADLRKSGVKTKVRPLSTGRTIGGIPFTRGSLAYFLRNCFYIGEVKYKDEVFQGAQTAILDRKLFEAVQTKLDQQRSNHIAARHASDSLLMGRIYDSRGDRMTPTHATKAGVRYRYYISTALIQGQKSNAATLSRVPAAEIEQLVVATVRQHVRTPAHKRDYEHDTPELNDKHLISTHVARVDVKSDHLVVRIATMSEQQSGEKVETNVLNHHDGSDRSENQIAQTDASTNVLRIPWKKMPAKRPREIIPPVSVSVSPQPDKRPIRAETRAKLIASIAKGRQWLEEWTAGTVTNAEQIATRENCTIRQVNMTISLAFLTPVLVQAAVEGRLPRGIGVANLRDAPAEWSRQHAMLGLSVSRP